MRMVFPGLCIICGVMIIGTVAVYMIAKKLMCKQKIVYAEFVWWLTIYIVALFYITIFSRSATNGYKINLAPFQDIIAACKSNRYRDLEYPLFNAIMFIPEGILVWYILYISKKASLKRAISACMGTILSVEMIQYLTCRGIFDIDDIIFNTIGFFFGWYAAKVIYRLTHT